ncbi:MAG: hypothetical protein IPM29_30650 [Planctomycetes bacterium]|nr:hypothetical protein [Planctomycetota bacterium]
MLRSRLASLLPLLLARAVVAQEPVWTLDGTALRFADGGALPGVVRDARVAHGALDLAAATARVTFAPDPRLAAPIGESFTLELELRTSGHGFATPWMCRAGSAVHHSFVIGREAGHISFEAWSWQRERVTSRAPIDDGRWHLVRAVRDAGDATMALFVDGELQAVGPCTGEPAAKPAPGLRLGDNLDAAVDQHFDGEIRRAALRSGIPAELVATLAVFRGARVLAPGEAEARMRAWNDRLRVERPPAAASRADWERRAAAVRAEVQDALGLWPPPYGGEQLVGRASPLSGGAGGATDFARFEPALPLDFVRGRTLARDGYTVTRVAWRTFDRFWATGWLYEPAPPRNTPAPAVLCPHGHWPEGARAEAVVARSATFAASGVVALAPDSIHIEDLASGLSSVSIMTWNNLRALQYLRARPDVDPARIGCTGASGGGQQTYYLAALDSGLAAAAPVVMAAHFSEITPADGVHCRCNHVPHLAGAVDMPEMAAAFAPHPQLFETVDGDWTAHFHERGYPEVRAIYELLGAGDATALLRHPGGHRFDATMRAEVAAFLGNALGFAPVAEPPGFPSPAELAAIADLEVARDADAIVAEFRTRLSAPAPDGTEPVGPLRERLRALLGAHPGPVEVTPCAPRVETIAAAWRVRADADIELPMLRPAGGPRAEDAAGVALVVAEAGATATLLHRAVLIAALHGAGLDVLLADVRYLGELDAGAGFRDAHGRFRGVDEGVLACRDLRRLVAAVPALAPGRRPVVLIGLGSAGATALEVGALDGASVAAVIVPELGAEFAAGRAAPRTSRVLLHGDLQVAVRVAGDADGGTRVALGGVGGRSAYAKLVGARGSADAAPLDVDRIVALARAAVGL